MAIVKTAAASVLRQTSVRNGAMKSPHAAARTSIEGSVCGRYARFRMSRKSRSVTAARVASITKRTTSL